MDARKQDVVVAAKRALSLWIDRGQRGMIRWCVGDDEHANAVTVTAATVGEPKL